MPFHNVYQPGLHVTVAAAATFFHLTPQHAYHLITALMYSLGPVTLFWFCWKVTGKPAYAFAVGLVYSLISTGAILSRELSGDSGGPFHPHRFQILTMWGEGPHVCALTILPIVLLFLYRAAVERKRIYLPLASLALAALVLTNWPGTIGLVMAIAAFGFSEMGEKRLSWLRLIVIAAVAYLLACRWIPPSTILLVPRNAQQTDSNYFHLIHLAYLAGLALVIASLHFGLRRAGASAFLRFGCYFTFFTGFVVLAHLWFRRDFLPQPYRFQLEMEMAVAILLCYLVKLALDRTPAKVRVALVAVLLLSAIPLIRSNRRFARFLSEPLDMTRTSEYREAQAFARLRPHDRVFAPGNIGYWMNLWNDTPQVSGCCDQGVPDVEHRVSDYAIYTGQNAGARDAEISSIWLRAYGATAIATDGPRSTEPFKPFWHPAKFEGVLPVLWRDGDDVIYEVPERLRSLAHVIPAGAVIARAPENGLAVEPMEKYVAAIEDPALPEARFEWTSRHSAHIATSVQPDQRLAVQVSFDPGWNAWVRGARRPIRRDKLGQMVIDTGCSGACIIEMVYDGGDEARSMNGMQIVGLLLLFAMPAIFRTSQSGSIGMDGLPARARSRA
jgi:uncharacterized membrane protein